MIEHLTASDWAVLVSMVYFVFAVASYNSKEMPWWVTIVFLAGATGFYLISGNVWVTYLLDRSDATAIGYGLFLVVALVLFAIAEWTDLIGGCADYSPTDLDGDSDE